MQNHSGVKSQSSIKCTWQSKGKYVSARTKIYHLTGRATCSQQRGGWRWRWWWQVTLDPAGCWPPRGSRESWMGTSAPWWHPAASAPWTSAGSAGEDTVQAPGMDNAMQGRGEGGGEARYGAPDGERNKKTSEAATVGVSEEKTEGEGGKKDREKVRKLKQD